jgi:hypothetical protein
MHKHDEEIIIFKLLELHSSGQTDPGRYIELDPEILEGCVLCFEGGKKSSLIEMIVANHL